MTSTEATGAHIDTCPEAIGPRTGTCPDAVRAELDRVLIELGIEQDAITSESTLRGTFELDSTETVQVSLELSRAFGIKLQLEAGEDLSVAQVCDLVVQYASASGTGE